MGRVFERLEVIAKSRKVSREMVSGRLLQLSRVIEVHFRLFPNFCVPDLQRWSKTREMSLLGCEESAAIGGPLRQFGCVPAGTCVRSATRVGRRLRDIPVNTSKYLLYSTTSEI